jgi:hypothetical protein
MNCRVVYFFVPNKPLSHILEDQARIVAKKQPEAKKPEAKGGVVTGQQNEMKF